MSLFRKIELFFFVDHISGFTPDPLPSPAAASSVPEPWAGELWDWAPDPEPVWSEWGAVAWGLALSPSTWTLGLVFWLCLATAFFSASWMALSMSALRSLRAEVSVVFNGSLNWSGEGRPGLPTGWGACASTRHILVLSGTWNINDLSRSVEITVGKTLTSNRMMC